MSEPSQKMKADLMLESLEKMKADLRPESLQKTVKNIISELIEKIGKKAITRKEVDMFFWLKAAINHLSEKTKGDRDKSLNETIENTKLLIKDLQKLINPGFTAMIYNKKYTPSFMGDEAGKIEYFRKGPLHEIIVEKDLVGKLKGFKIALEAIEQLRSDINDFEENENQALIDWNKDTGDGVTMIDKISNRLSGIKSIYS